MDNIDWVRMAAISMVCLIFLVIILPYMMYRAWLQATRDMIKTKFKSRGCWSFFFEDFRDGSLEWVIVALMKDIALNLIACFGARDGSLQLFLCALLSIAYAHMLLRKKPYADLSNTYLEVHNSIAAALISFYSACMGFQKAADSLDGTDLFEEGAADPVYERRALSLFILQLLCTLFPVLMLGYQFLQSFQCSSWCLPQDKLDEWVAKVIEKADLKYLEDMDDVERTKLQTFWQTTTATLGQCPHRSGFTSRRLQRLQQAQEAETLAVTGQAAQHQTGIVSATLIGNPTDIEANEDDGGDSNDN